MSDRPSILGVSGSRRDGSYTRAATARVLEACEGAGARTDLLALDEADLPLYHPDRDEQGESAALTARVRAADGVVLASPVYHGSYASTLKNFHDYSGAEEYEGTAVGLLCVAGGSSYGATLEHMREVVRGVHGHCVPEQVGVTNASRAFDADGAFVDEDLADRVDTFARSLVEHAALYRDATERRRTTLATADD